MSVLADFYKAIFKKLRGKGFGWGIFNKVHETVWRRLQPDFVDVRGMRLYLPPRDEGVSYELRMEGDWEPEEASLFERRISQGATVLDVGANVGYYTVLASRLVGDRGRVLAFEPEPQNFALLMRNLEVNRCTNVTVWPYAVSTELGYVDLHLTWPASTGSHSIAYRPEKGEAKSIRVVTVRLDDFLEPDTWPDLIKMDIEGAELAALQGMPKILGSPRLRTLFLECSESILGKIGRKPEEVTGFLAGQGFQIRRIGHGSDLYCTRDRSV